MRIYTSDCGCELISKDIGRGQYEQFIITNISLTVFGNEVFSNTFLNPRLSTVIFTC